MTLNTATFHRHGAEEARRAHNSEVVRSKRTAGILHFTRFTETGRHSLSDVKHERPFTGVAQRQRAGLITLRSLDRDESPVLLHFARFIETGRHSLSDAKHERRFTGVAHRQRAGLITLR